MVKILLGLFTVGILSSCILFKPRIETVEKVVVEKQVVTEKGDTITLFDTITKTVVKDRFIERQETKREKTKTKYAFKTLKEENSFLKDSLNIVRKQNKDDNRTIERLESEQTKQDRIHKREVVGLEKQISKQIKQQEKSDRQLYWVIGTLGLLLFVGFLFVIRKRRYG